LGISDNVFRQMAPGTKNHVRVDIPYDHPSGTFWYHPHKHGSTTFQVIGGMAGFLIVKGGPGTLDELPEIKAAKDLVMGFQVIRAGVNGDAVRHLSIRHHGSAPTRRVQHIRVGWRTGTELLRFHDQRRNQPDFAYATG
jgi:FtsP/CotA-like multicopper oxidase with cupredoxin domain